MKPMVSNNEKPSAVVIQQPRNDGKNPRPKFRTALITSCLVVLCVAALSIGLYFGLREKKTVVENHVYFKELQGGDVITANVTVTKNEESFNFENAAVIYDFSTVLGQTDFEEFRVTDVWLNEEALGPLSRDLCADEEINFIEKVKGDGDGAAKDAAIDDDDDDGLPDLGALVPEENQRSVRRSLFRRIRIRIRIRIRVNIRFRRRK